MSDQNHLECTLCGDEVSKRRATILQQPTVIMCPLCYEDNIDDLYTLSKRFSADPEEVEEVLQ